MLGDRPTILQLRSFAGNIDFAEQVTDYKRFGSCLLNADTGSKIANIVASNQGNVVNINNDIFNEFLIGRGLRPVNWRTFIECLERSGLHVLVEDILREMNAKERGMWNFTITTT